jgi:hypothetical protein
MNIEAEASARMIRLLYLLCVLLAATTKAPPSELRPARNENDLRAAFVSAAGHPRVVLFFSPT